MRENIFPKDILVLLLVLVTVCGCGYTTKSLISRDIETIYIPIFGNETFRRDLEFGLAKELKDEVLSKTSLRIVDKAIADAVLTGTITKVQETMLISGTSDNIVENRISLFVDFKLVERGRGKDRTMVDAKDVQKDAEFIINRGETMLSAYDEVVADMAETIVHLIEEKW